MNLNLYRTSEKNHSIIFNMLKYLDISEIKILQIEVTSLCNLVCPQCARIYEGKLNPLLPLSELTPEDYDKIFHKENMPQLREVIFNGNFGDPVASKYLNYAIEILIKKKIAVKIFTNGSLRSVSWWKNLGSLFSNTNSNVVFSIDGLKGTNAIYRINSKFEKIMDNARSYIQAGGKARWDFLIFQHNEHQLEEAKALAKQMGFTAFLEKQTARFIVNENKKTYKKKSENIFNKKSQTIGKLKQPQSEKKDFEMILKKYGSWEKYIDTTPIHCKYKNNMQALYIDFMARVWPCCWLGSPLYSNYSENPQKKQLNSIIKKYKKNFNSLRHYSLTDILSHEWFDSKLVESWKNKTTDENFKLVTCGRTCGVDYEYTSGPGYKNAIRTQFKCT